MTQIISEKPLLRLETNFLTQDECEKIIGYARDSMVPGQVLNHKGEALLNLDYRTASTTTLDPKTYPLVGEVLERVSKYTGYPVDSFEACTVTSYKPGEQFKNHQDYFCYDESPEALENTKKRCFYGGNRISTVLLYLNDVRDGGQTIFPWLDYRYQPRTGSLLQFDYNYDDWRLNIRSQHASVPLGSGEKWIISIWVRERPRQITSEEYKTFREESFVFSQVKDTKFDLTVGPKGDRRILSVRLPANNHPQNSIVVGFTGGMDSCLLLYLLATLNSHQLCPYTIHPVCVTGFYNSDNENSIKEDYENAKYMLNVVRGLVDSPIRDLHYVSAVKNTPPEHQLSDGLMGYYSFTDANGLAKMRDIYFNKFIYTGCNETPNDSNPIWRAFPQRGKNKNSTANPIPFWKQPFMNLQKYHIVDALLQLELEDILEKTSKCGRGHQTLSDNCDYFACMERRWAFEKLGQSELGKKLLLGLEPETLQEDK